MESTAGQFGAEESRFVSVVLFFFFFHLCVFTEKMLNGLIKFALLQVLLAALSVDNREKIVLQFNSLAQYYKVTNFRTVFIFVHLYFWKKY